GDRERRHVPRPDRCVAGLDRLADILRVMVPPPDDDQFLDPPGDEELASVQEAEVTGPQVNCIHSRVIGPGPEGLPGRAGLVPVTRGDARPRDPDLTDPAGSAGDPGLGIDDQEPDGLQRYPAADEGPGGGVRLCNWLDVIALERRGTDREQYGG